MMKTIIADSKAVENEAIRGEEYDQKFYEDFVKDSNLSIDAKLRKIVNKSEIKAKAESDQVEAENQLESVKGELEALDEENADLHKDCDFTLKNFDIRQTARDDEIMALKQSLAMFGGAAFAAFLETENPAVETSGPDDSSTNTEDASDAPAMSYAEWEAEHDDDEFPALIQRR